MSPRLAVWVLAAAMLAAPALPAAAAPAAVGPAVTIVSPKECNGLPRCISVPGPWVAVPASGGVDYLLECPGGKGIVGGTDALVTSQAIQVSFDGIPGSPVSFGRTTNYEVLFRAVAADHRAGAFEPFIGCIPTQGSTRNTTGVAVEPLGPPLTLLAKTVPLAPGAARSAALGCPSGERLTDSWTATAFATAAPPPPGLAAAIRVSDALRGGSAIASVAASEALPPGAQAQVQLGVRCSSA